MDKKETTSPEKEAALKALRTQFTGTDTPAQITLLAAALRLYSISTYEASRFLDIYHPAGRIKDLRKQGYNILTVWTTVQTEAGVAHRIGRYVLLAEPPQALPMEQAA
jgi:Helix-turn-helix domain